MSTIQQAVAPPLMFSAVSASPPGPGTQPSSFSSDSGQPQTVKASAPPQPTSDSSAAPPAQSTANEQSNPVSPPQSGMDPLATPPTTTAPSLPSHEADSTSSVGGGVGEDPRNLIVNYIPTPVTDMQLRELFSPFGAIETARVILDRVTQHPKGYGFVKFYQVEHAKAAMEAMNGYVIHNKRLKVTTAKGPANAAIGNHAQRLQTQVLQAIPPQQVLAQTAAQPQQVTTYIVHTSAPPSQFVVPPGYFVQQVQQVQQPQPQPQTHTIVVQSAPPTHLPPYPGPFASSPSGQSPAQNPPGKGQSILPAPQQQGSILPAPASGQPQYHIPVSHPGQTVTVSQAPQPTQQGGPALVQYIVVDKSMQPISAGPHQVVTSSGGPPQGGVQHQMMGTVALPQQYVVSHGGTVVQHTGMPGPHPSHQIIHQVVSSGPPAPPGATQVIQQQGPQTVVNTAGGSPAPGQGPNFYFQPIPLGPNNDPMYHDSCRFSVGSSSYRSM